MIGCLASGHSSATQCNGSLWVYRSALRKRVVNVLARHALSRYDNAFLQNDNAFLSFQITPISMSNNCIFWRYE